MTGSAEERRAAEWSVRLVAVAVVAVIGAAVAVILVASGVVGSDDEPDRSSASEPGSARDAIGPGSGQPVADYMATQRLALDAVSGERVAVVSLTRYVTSAALDALLDDASGIDVLARLVAAPGGEPAAVAGSLSDWAAAERRAADEERAEIESLIPTLGPGDDEFAAFYADEVVRLEALSELVDAAGPVVFGVVIRAGAGQLRALAGEAEVRVVHVAPDGTDDDADFAGLLPDEVTVTGDPATRPLPPA